MSSNILDFYSSVLNGLLLSADETGLVSINPPGETKARPFETDGKRLALPTNSLLRHGGEDLQFFHPLSENLARGQSPVLKTLVKTIKTIVLFHVTEISRQLLRVASNVDYQKNLPAEWNEFFKLVKDADAKSAENFTKVLNAGLANKKNGIASIYLKHGGSIGGEKYLRTAHVHFGIVDAIKSKAPFNVKIRNKDVEVFLGVLRTVLPDIEEKEAYSVGVGTDIAPYFLALMKSYGRIVLGFNKAINLLKAVDSELKPISIDFLPLLDDVNRYYRQVPALSGNEGDPIKGAGPEEEQAAPAPSQPPVQRPQTPPPRPGRPQQPPPQRAPGRNNDWRQFAQPQQQQLPPWDVPPGYPQQQPPGYYQQPPQPQYQQGYYPQQQFPPQYQQQPPQGYYAPQQGYAQPQQQQPIAPNDWRNFAQPR